eukprot:SAG31_NODE_11936_length_984_cov_0.759322_1_plen_164_part_10
MLKSVHAIKFSTCSRTNIPTLRLIIPNKRLSCYARFFWRVFHRELHNPVRNRVASLSWRPVGGRADLSRLGVLVATNSITRRLASMIFFCISMISRSSSAKSAARHSNRCDGSQRVHPFSTPSSSSQLRGLAIRPYIVFRDILSYCNHTELRYTRTHPRWHPRR